MVSAGVRTDPRRPRTTRCRSAWSAKQWMWKFQHRNGRRTIDELLVPLGQPVKLLHDVAGRDPQFLRAGVPHQAGRAAGPLHDAVVHATRAGELPSVLRRVLRHRSLAHDRAVAVLSKPAFAHWLRAAARRRLAAEHARRASCFSSSAAAAATSPRPRSSRPTLSGLFGSTVPLHDGRTVIADEHYLRDSILHPTARYRRRLRADHARRSQPSLSEEQCRR